MITSIYIYIYPIDLLFFLSINKKLACWLISNTHHGFLLLSSTNLEHACLALYYLHHAVNQAIMFMFMFSNDSKLSFELQFHFQNSVRVVNKNWIDIFCLDAMQLQLDQKPATHCLTNVWQFACLRRRTEACRTEVKDSKHLSSSERPRWSSRQWLVIYEV